MACLLAASIVLLFLPIWPALDMAISQHFYQAGQGFYMDKLPWVQWVYRYTPSLGRGIALVCLVTFLLGRFYPKHITKLAQRVGLSVFLVAVLGSGVMVDLIIKPSWSRPRPVHVLEFGGDKNYQSPTQPCFHCARQYSFVSGHAAAGFSLMAFGAAGSMARRRGWFLAGLASGGFIGFVRIVQGGHFLSDVVFSLLTITLVYWAVCWLLERYLSDA
jgi:lipid A 4'-phosphatase